MAITILDLAEYRHMLKGKGDQIPGEYNGAWFAEVDLAMMGGCQYCAASIAAYNAYPSKTGYWRCGDCILDHGFETVKEAHEFIDSPIHEAT